jgi:Flp pilus assembly protein TadG
MTQEQPTTRSRRRTSQRGSGLIEGALCFSSFLFITFGVMEFAMAVYGYNFCHYAAEDAARWASTRGANYLTPATSASVQNYVTNEAIGLTNALTVTTTWTPNNSPGSTVQVTVVYTVIPLTGVTLHANFQVSGTAQMIVSN